MYQDLIDKKKKLAVVGLGYVGLPLLLEFWRSGCKVVGLDIDSSKIEALNAGRSYIRHIDSKLVAEADFLRHPEDPRDAAVFRPQVPVDEFVLKYQKPL